MLVPFLTGICISFEKDLIMSLTSSGLNFAYFILFYFSFWDRVSLVVQADLEFTMQIRLALNITIFLTPSPKCWDYKHVLFQLWFSLTPFKNVLFGLWGEGLWFWVTFVSWTLPFASFSLVLGQKSCFAVLWSWPDFSALTSSDLRLCMPLQKSYFLWWYCPP